jgi:hypothetical protein
LLIEIKDVSTTFTKTAKGGYSTAVIGYVNEKGESKAWKLISFANPATFDVLKNAKEGERYEIVTGKNDKDFTEWRSATKSEGNAAPASAKSAPSTAVRSTYETPDERAARQRLIVRQSSLGHAIEILTTGGKSPPNVVDVKNMAEELVAFVYDAPDLFDEPNDLEGAV